MNEELFYRLALLVTPGISNGMIKKMIQKFGSAKSIYETDSRTIQKIFKIKIPPIELTSSIEKEVKREWIHIQKNEIKVALFDQPDYPQRVQVCKSFPNLFFYLGEPHFNHDKVLSVVGTREASNYGADVVQKLISEIAPSDPLIVSGLALGIDTLAHEAALKNNLKTIGILGSGLGKIYPASNMKLIHKMVQNGSTVMSEYLYHQTPDKTNFPERNRIIASISDATLVVETKTKGGSIITAKMASGYQKKLFAVPGSIFEAGQAGCNELIQNGMAKMVTSGKEILQMLFWDNQVVETYQPSLFFDFTEEEEKLLRMIQKKGKLTIDEIVAQSVSNSPSQIVTQLLKLEFQGIIECGPGKVYRIIKK